MTTAEARARAAKCGRRVNILVDAGEYDLAREQLAEAKYWSLLALELERDQVECDLAPAAG